MNKNNKDYNKMWRFLSEHIPDRNLVTKIADYVEKEYFEKIIEIGFNDGYDEGYAAAEDEFRDESDSEYHNGFIEAREKIWKYLYETLDCYSDIVDKIKKIQPD